MNKHVCQILYTSVALGATLFAVTTLDNTAANADANTTPQAAQTTPASTTAATAAATNTSANNNAGSATTDTNTTTTTNNSSQQSVDTAALDQAEAQKQAQYEKAEDSIVSQYDATHGMGPGSRVGSFSQKPTSSFSPALAQELYKASDAHNDIVTKDVDSYANSNNTDALDHTISMVSNFTYKNGAFASSLADQQYGLPKRTDVSTVPQDDQFYIDWLDHEIKLAKGETTETYQVPASYTNLLNRIKSINENYGTDMAKGDSNSDTARFYGLPGFDDWNSVTGMINNLLLYPGKSEYDVKFYTPYLTSIINQWESKHAVLQQEYAAKNKTTANKTDKTNTPAAKTSTKTATATATPAAKTAQPAQATSKATVKPATTPAKTNVVNNAATTEFQTPVTAKAQTAAANTLDTVTLTTPVKESVTNQSALPQTGNEGAKAVSVLGLGLVTLAAMFGLGRKRQF